VFFRTARLPGAQPEPNPKSKGFFMSNISILSATTPSMNSKEIADLVEKRHDNVKRTIESLAEQGVVVLPQSEEVPFVDESGRNRTTAAYVFSGPQGKRDSIVVVAQLSPEFTARLVDRWQALESGLAAPGAVPHLPLPYQPDPELQIAELAARMLRLSDTSKLRMLSALCDQRGVSPRFLPAYVDEPLTRSLTALLKEHNAGILTRVANRALIGLGFVEELERKGSRGEIKTFKSLTEAGLRYGRNETSPQNPRETQPLYYVARFPELLDLILNELDMSEAA
jgi:phage regulator Rha-like protein